MFLSEQIIFLELHKTGCTHIRNLLMNTLGGHFLGKHNQADSRLCDSGATFLGSVRNPWDWYVSLWAYGCDRKGYIYTNLTKPKWLCMKGSGWRTNPYLALRTTLALTSNNPAEWRKLYRCSNDAGAFREWLFMIHDSNNRDKLGEGYGASSISKFSGLLTYRYFNLFCLKSNEKAWSIELNNFEELKAYDRENCFIDYFIRNEFLEADLISAMEKSGVDMLKNKKDKIFYSGRTNTSSRGNDLNYYYDSRTEKLVFDKDKFIIEKFGYSFPSE